MKKELVLKNENTEAPLGRLVKGHNFQPFVVENDTARVKIRHRCSNFATVDGEQKTCRKRKVMLSDGIMAKLSPCEMPYEEKKEESKSSATREVAMTNSTTLAFA